MGRFAQGVGKILVLAILAAVISGGSFLAGYGAHWVPTVLRTPAVAADPSTAEEEAFRTFWQGWHLLQQDYYGEVPDLPAASRAALRGVIETLDDPYTVLVDPAYAAILRQDMSGSFEGIGALVRINEEGRLEVVEAFGGQPADLAGLRRGDVILQVDDVPIRDMNVMEAVALVRGPEGTTIRLLVLRAEEEEPFELSLERKRIQIPSIQTRLFELTAEDGAGQRVAYLKLREFHAAVPMQFRSALGDLLAQGPDALILDLRGNPGGFLHVAVAVGSEFVADGPIVVERMRDGEEIQFPAQPGGLATDPTLPLVVLVDPGSASATEIVAGAIQDSGRGILLGEPTFGKGSVQLAYSLDDGSELRVTTARWFTPQGRAIQGEGLEPDVVVGADPTAGSDDLDPQLAAAMDYLAQQIRQRLRE